MMTKTAAIKQAKSESTMYRQGAGWVVSVYDDTRGAWRLSGEADFWRARTRLRLYRAERALELLYGRDENGMPVAWPLSDEGSVENLVAEAISKRCQA